MTATLAILTALGVLALVGWLTHRVVKLQKQLLQIRPSEEYLEEKRAREQADSEEEEKVRIESQAELDRIRAEGLTSTDWSKLYARIQELKKRN